MEILPRRLVLPHRARIASNPERLWRVSFFLGWPPADAPWASAARGQKTSRPDILAKLPPLFDELYAEEGRPSIPPEQLLKSRILMALYSVRSERLFCEQLAYNLLWLWFLDRELDEGNFDPTVFTYNYERVLSADAAKLFFCGGV